MTLSLAVIDLVALWAVLRPGRVRWRLALLVIVAAALEILIVRFADKAAPGVGLRWSSNPLQVWMYDVYYLVPILVALFLVRAGGYRWTASQSLSP